ncbi:MAG: LruC domain-containing protein [Paludibacter sp.]|nr:LruC domain-containing protein [Paludibacter sp.]
MRFVRKIVPILALLISILGFNSCLNKLEEIQVGFVSSDFDYKTIKEYSVSIQALDANNDAFKSAYIELYTSNPLNENGTLSENSASNLIFKGVTDASGKMECKISPATTVDSLYVLARQIGLPNCTVSALSSTDLTITIGGNFVEKQSLNSVAQKIKATTIPSVAKTNDHKYYVLGSWNTLGVPNYLTTDDVISQSLLDDIDATLPEYKSLPTTHPEYFQSNDDSKIVLVKDAEVWVTFVHEGASYKNSLLYYTYPTGSEPSSTNQISNATVIFPNVSGNGSGLNGGGGLYAGNKVQLFYYNKATNTYSNIFPAGTTVAWMFKSNAWSNYTVGNGYNTFYSDLNLNPESNTSLKKHNVVLKDDVRKLLLLGFEDIRRDQNSDNDFNDAVFYATVTPFTAVSGVYQKIVSTSDTDNDGVGDEYDEYPNDPDKAFNNYYPSENGVGTLAYEDLYPSKGDYDFNDMVIDYNFNQITNANNKVVVVDMKLNLRAIGASYVNGFGIQFNTDPDNVKSVTGQNLSENIVNLLSTGVEAGQSKAVVIAFDNAFKILPHPGNGIGVNTTIGATYVEPQELDLSIELNSPVAVNDLGTPPYNPFIFIDKIRSKEVHLPTYEPTDLADESLFGTEDDNSNPTAGKYYVSDKYLPWAINLPVQFDYPAEKEDITNAYLLFKNWANSNGAENVDWYLNISGYRTESKIYKH